MGQPQQLSHQAMLALIIKIQIFAILSGVAEQRTREPKYFKELCVPKRGCDLAVFGERSIGFHFGYLVHLTSELRQQLHSYHAMFYRTLENSYDGTMV